MPAILENDRFKMAIYVAGYEFEHSVRDPSDANWLIFRVVLRSVLQLKEAPETMTSEKARAKP